MPDEDIEITAEELAANLEAFHVVDVREAVERDEEIIEEESGWLPLSAFGERWNASLPGPETRLVFY